MNLVDQRCANHALREAAVECPSCKRFFCRECVTEHQGRMMCVACVSAFARGGGKAARRAGVGWTAMALAGILIAWLLFYYLGQTLAKLPSEFHGASNQKSLSSVFLGSAWRRPKIADRQLPPANDLFSSLLDEHVGRAILPAADFQAAFRGSAEVVFHGAPA